MATLPPQVPDRAFWSGEGGRRWLAGEKYSRSAVAPFGRAALAVAAPRQSERVADIGCGTGETTFEIAEAVGERGSALGIDISADLLAVARERATHRGLSNVDFLEADVEEHELGRDHFDLVYSRFGLMFFSDPTAAFARLHRATKPHGRLVFVCWRTFKENPWGLIPFAAAAPHLPEIARLGPEDPGPFSFGDPARIERILKGSGWRDSNIAPLDLPVALAKSGGLDEAMPSCACIGAVARLLAVSSEQQRQAALSAIRLALEKHVRDDGRIELPGACWIVSARA